MALGRVIAQATSSFGPELTTTGPEGLSAKSIYESVRFRMLDRRGAYYACTQHDHKDHDFDGRPIQKGDPLLGTPNLASDPSDAYIPLKARRPTSPYRLARVIVDSFTTMVFGYQRWPTLRSPGDPETESFARALVEATALKTLMIQERAIAGSTGTAMLSWRFWNGKPRVQVHHAKYLHVHKWADREAGLVEHVSEIYRYTREEWNAETKKFEPRWYWFRRDWTPVGDIAFREIRDDANAEPNWVIDEEKSYRHDDGFPHVVWIKNLPSDLPEEIDGIPDYEGLYENFDAIDVINSCNVRGTAANLDPTLVLKMDPDLVSRHSVKKGSGNALTVGINGDAHYMELQGTAVTAGMSLFAKMRESALEVAQCVIPDPNQIGAAGTSSVALKVVYAPMLGKADVLREQQERGLRELLQQMIRSARRAKIGQIVEVVNDDGSITEQHIVLELPPRAVTEDVVDEATGAVSKVEKIYEQRPGPSDVLTFDWGDYFLPTAADQQQTSTSLSTLVGGKLISQESGADLAARVLRIDPRADWERIQKEGQKLGVEPEFADTPDGQQNGGQGLGVDGENDLPPDAQERDAGAGDDGVQVDELAAKMSAHGVERCEHAKLNRCWICGIERVRDFEPGADGQPEWKIGWRRIPDGERR